MIPNKKAIFFDNDGVLVDTEKLYFEASRQILAEIGFELTKELYLEYLLIQGIGIWHLLDPKYTEADKTELKERRNKLFTEFVLTRDIHIEGLEQLLANLSKKYRMCIVTSSKPDHFIAIHSRNNLLQYFEFVITSDDFTLFKPHPEPYLKALERMKLEPDEVIVVEDTQRGLSAAKAAGLECIIVRSELTKSCAFPEADYIVDNVLELRGML